ncbi:MAG: hypothetical protein QM496_02855 [Verrucomicrobiota bacterium]
MNSTRIFLILAASLTLTLTSCVAKRTVKDSSGNTIYSDTIIKKPFQSDTKTNQQVFDKEDELGAL